MTKHDYHFPTQHKKVRLPIGLVKRNPFAGPIQWEEGTYRHAPRKGTFRGSRGGPPRRLDTTDKYSWDHLPVRIANGVPEMPYGYWKIAQLIPDYGREFLVAMDLQDWTDEHMRLWASRDKEFEEAHTKFETRRYASERRKARKMVREGAMSEEEFIGIAQGAFPREAGREVDPASTTRDRARSGPEPVSGGQIGRSQAGSYPLPEKCGMFSSGEWEKRACRSPGAGGRGSGGVSQ